jgi:hypothetical protein
MIVVGTTCVAWKCNGNETSWLDNAEAMAEDAHTAGHELTFFPVLEVDDRGEQPFSNLFDRLFEVSQSGPYVDHWSFRLWDGELELNSDNRLPRICAGRNFVQDYAMRPDVAASHILFLDTDIRPDGDCISKLLELDWPMCGGNVGQYALSGPPVERRPPGPADARMDPIKYDFPVERHWNTAGFLLVGRDVFRRVRWRVDGDAAMSDDPCYDADATRLGYPTIVRKDLQGQHIDPLIPVEMRTEDRMIRQ